MAETSSVSLGHDEAVFLQLQLEGGASSAPKLSPTTQKFKLRDV